MFSYPLPPLVRRLRSALYPRLVPIANRWQERMGLAPRFPRGTANSSPVARPPAS